METVAVLLQKLGADQDWKSYTNYILDHQEMLKNQKIIRNEGYLKSLTKETND